MASLNWVGLTRMDTTTNSDWDLANLIKLACPSCNAPIVGTKPVTFSCHPIEACHWDKASSDCKRTMWRGSERAETRRFTWILGRIYLSWSFVLLLT